MKLDGVLLRKAAQRKPSQKLSGKKNERKSRKTYCSVNWILVKETTINIELNSFN